VFALAIIGWAFKDPVLFLPLLLALPIVGLLWFWEHRQVSVIAGFAGLLVQGLVTSYFATGADLRRATIGKVKRLLGRTAG
jgi:hypothetical protein